MLSFFKSIVWKSAAPTTPTRPIAASMRAERIARFKEGIETLRRQAEEEEDYRGCGVPRQYPGKPMCIPVPEPVAVACAEEDDRHCGVPDQRPRGPRVIYDPAIHGPCCP